MGNAQSPALAFGRRTAGDEPHGANRPIGVPLQIRKETRGVTDKADKGKASGPPHRARQDLSYKKRQEKPVEPVSEPQTARPRTNRKNRLGAGCRCRNVARRGVLV